MPDFIDADFEWDVVKSDTNFADHHVDFAYAAHIFDGPTIEAFDESHSDEEDRFVVIGLIEGRFFFVVFTMRGRRRRIISARLATKSERNKWYEQYG